MALLSGGSYNLDIIHGLPPLINNLSLTQFSKNIAEKSFGKENVFILDEPSMGAEDFAFYVQKVPGTFMWIGGRNEEKGFINYMHHPQFNFDEKALSIGSKMHIRIALEYLNEK